MECQPPGQWANLKGPPRQEAVIQVQEELRIRDRGLRILQGEVGTVRTDKILDRKCRKGRWDVSGQILEATRPRKRQWGRQFEGGGASWGPAGRPAFPERGSGAQTRTWPTSKKGELDLVRRTSLVTLQGAVSVQDGDRSLIQAADKRSRQCVAWEEEDSGKGRQRGPAAVPRGQGTGSPEESER